MGKIAAIKPAHNMIWGHLIVGAIIFFVIKQKKMSMPLKYRTQAYVYVIKILLD